MFKPTSSLLYGFVHFRPPWFLHRDYSEIKTTAELAFPDYVSK